MTRPNFSPLLYADTDRSADALYFGGVSVPDPFIAFGFRGKKYAVVSALEFGRVKKTSDFDVVLPLEQYLQKAHMAFRKRRPDTAGAIAVLAKELRIPSFTVPVDFPAGVFDQCRQLGVKIKVADGALFPEREIKSNAEAEHIREGNHCSALGFAAVEKILRGSKIRGSRLIYRGETVTSEMLKFAIESACLKAGAISNNTIVAGGDQGCDPHERGSGPIRPNELIVVDIFPRVTATGFFGDMTRTFLKGRASDAQQRLVKTVRDGQKLGLKTIRAGINAQEVHRKIVELFTSRGYETKHTPKGSVGFFHGTGHGVGMDIHEPPRVNATNNYILKKGTVVTVEPGLYYPGVGGCRIEDMVQLTATGVKMLSKYHYDWEFR